MASARLRIPLHRAPIRFAVVLHALCAALGGHAQTSAEFPRTDEQNAVSPRAASIRPTDGVAIDYDLLSQPGLAGPGRLRGVIEVPHGSVVASVLVNPGAASGNRFARLDTRWQASLPYPLQTLVVGDTVGSGGGWSRAVRFGGVRMGRAPMLRPGAVDGPADLGDPAALPGGVLALSAGHGRTLNGGGHGLALAGGPDSALAAARELLGAAPVGAHTGLGTLQPLPAGASDYELEAGRLRSGWGTGQDRYGDSYAALGYRHGLGADLNAEGRAEWTDERIATGLELSQAWAGGTLVRVVVAGSSATAPAGSNLSGLRRGLSLEGRAGDTAWRLAWDGFDRDYTALAEVPGEPGGRRRIRAGTSLPLWGRATATLSYAYQSRWSGTPDGVVGLAASMPLGERTRLDLNYTLRSGPQTAWQAGVKFSVPLDAIPGG